MSAVSKIAIHRTLVLHTRFASRSHRTKAAFDREQGLIPITMEQLASRLAGGFLAPIDSDRLKTAVATATGAPLAELDAIKDLPGFQRAAAATLTKAWRAGLTLEQEAENAADEAAKARLASLSILEREVLSRLPTNQVRPRDLVTAASERVGNAPSIFGRIEIRGHTEMSPVWRPMLTRMAQHGTVVWVAEAREIPGWLSETKIAVQRAPPSKPTISTVSCASPRHEILEAFRWARRHLARGVLPQQIAITTASPETWDDHVLAMAESANLPLHFMHGRTALSAAEGQLAAALAEILLRGFSRTRIVRLVALLRIQCKRFEALPSDWWRTLPSDAPLLDAPRWLRAIRSLVPESSSDENDHRPLLEETIETLRKGLGAAAEVGEALLDGRPLAIWRKALTEGPPAALDVTLNGLRFDDGVDPGAAIVWGPAAEIAAVPRPFTWLVGLSSRSWPRRAAEDPLLPDHVVEAARLDPLPVHEADRRDFRTICCMTEREVFCSRARRDSEGRLNGISPLFPHHCRAIHLAQSREAEHAATAADRLMARPDEFEGMPGAVSARQAWTDWHRNELSGHDGLVRANHPLLLRALDRRQSASSLVRLLRDPLGYLWTYGFGWRVPEETDEPLTLDPLAFGNLLHEILQEAVTQLEGARGLGFASASSEAIQGVVNQAAEIVGTRWDETRPVPPPVVWHRKLDEAAELATAALSVDEQPLPGQRSWAEIPFGGDPRTTALSEEARGALPWDPSATVAVSGTQICIGGMIDRLDLAGDRRQARVTDYKSGRRRGSPPQINRGGELQRCLYAFAVKVLVETAPVVEARLVYPRSGNRPLALNDPEGTLGRLAQYLAAASTSFTRGRALPGPAAEDRQYDLSLALPAGAKEGYLATKLPLVTQALAAVAPVWEEP